MRAGLLALLLPLGLGAQARAASGAPSFPPSPTCGAARTALVLGGGGAKGMAHLGLLRALDSLGVTPDLIIGSSAGAVIGALWASGESAVSIEARLRAAHLERLVHPYTPTLGPAFDALAPAIVWERTPSRWVVQDGTVRDEEVEVALAALAGRADSIARGDFDALPIPFRAVATDLVTREVVALEDGSLVHALRASMAIPVLLHPVRHGGRALVDGGLGSNNPVAVARALGAERLIVSTIASPRPDADRLDDPLAVAGAVFEFLWVQDSLHLGAQDVLVAHPTAPYGMLDFRPATFDALVALGRRTADRALGAAPCLQPLGTARHTDVAVAPSDPARLLTAPRVAPPRLGLGVAFDHRLSGQLWVAGVRSDLLDGRAEGSVDAVLGPWRGALTIAARRHRAEGAARRLPLGFALTVESASLPVYDGVVETPPAHTDAVGLLVGILPWRESGWRLTLGAAARAWRQPGVPFTSGVGVHLGLSDQPARATAPTLVADATLLDGWRRARLDLAPTFSLGALTVTPRLRAGVGRRLPLAEAFALGGTEGFAGLPLLAGRGDHEALAAVAIRWPLRPRVDARVEPMLGRVGIGGLSSGPDPLHGRLQRGVRLGVVVTTPLGELRVEEGFGAAGRRAAFVRFGTWR